MRAPRPISCIGISLSPGDVPYDTPLLMTTSQMIKLKFSSGKGKFWYSPLFPGDRFQLELDTGGLCVKMGELVIREKDLFG